MKSKLKIIAIFLLLVTLPLSARRRVRKPTLSSKVEISCPEQIKIEFESAPILMSVSGLEYDMEARLRSYVAYLAGVECEGRGIGTRGAAAAAFYISSFFKNAQLDVHYNTFDVSGKVGRNILGIKTFPGATKYVVVMASYDGLGVLGGSLYPCADANASGVAALLELVNDVHIPMGRPKNFIYVAIDGHHSAMSGGEALVKYLKSKGISRSSIAMVINLDTIGSTLVPPRGAGKDYLMALGGKSMSYSMNLSNAGIGLNLSYDYYGSENFTELFYRRVSEQKHFLEMKVPCVMFTSGITDHTFKTSDTAQTLDYPVFARRVEFIRRWMRRF